MEGTTKARGIEDKFGNVSYIQIVEERVRNYKPKKLNLFGLRPSAVLIPIFRKDESIVFIKRTTTVKDHKGQVAFPGGVIDEEDGGDPIKTAIREAEEEIGLPKNLVEFIGFLDDTITIAGYLIHPVVGMIDEKSSSVELKPNPSEVERIIIVPIQELIEAEYVEKVSEPKWEFYLKDGTKIWGATARILKNFFEVTGLRKF